MSYFSLLLKQAFVLYIKAFIAAVNTNIKDIYGYYKVIWSQSGFS